MRTFTTRGEMLDHVRRVAHPEGRLLLRVLGQADERGDTLADALATVLQLAVWTVGLRSERSNSMSASDAPTPC